MRPLTATVSAAPAPGSRWCRVRFDGSTTDAPAAVAADVTLPLAVGDRVRVEMLGRRPLIVGGVVPSTTLAATGVLQYFTVPDGIGVLAVQVAGGAGVGVQSADIGAPDIQAGGRAARVTAYLPVTPGETLWLALGELGDTDGARAGLGFTGSGGRRGGGAASLLGRGTPSLGTALIVAGGGGGGGEDGPGGTGGGIGGASPGAGGGLGGGQDPTYTGSSGGDTAIDGCGGGGGGLVGGRAGTLSGDRRGGGGGGASRLPTGATVSSSHTGRGTATLVWGLAPLAPTLLSPAAGEVVAAGEDVDLRWVLNGQGFEDTQTSATVSYTTTAGTGSQQVTGPTTEAVLPAALTQPGPVTWQVATTGQGGVEGAAASGSFTLALAPGAPVITSPDGAPVTGADLVVAWLAGEQAAYRVRRTNGDASVVYADTGAVTDPSARDVALALALDTDGRTEVVRVSVRGTNGAWSPEDTVSVPVAWTRPATPVVSVSGDPATGSLLVAVTHPVEVDRPPVVSTTYQALRVDTRTRAGIVVGPDGRWRLPASGVHYVIAATGRDALGVPATGVTAAVGDGYGASPYGAAMYGT